MPVCVPSRLAPFPHRDAVRQFAIHQPVVGGFESQLADGGEPMLIVEPLRSAIPAGWVIRLRGHLFQSTPAARLMIHLNLDFPGAILANFLGSVNER